MVNRPPSVVVDSSVMLTLSKVYKGWSSSVENIAMFSVAGSDVDPGCGETTESTGNTERKDE